MNRKQLTPLTFKKQIKSTYEKNNFTLRRYHDNIKL